MAKYVVDAAFFFFWFWLDQSEWKGAPLIPHIALVAWIGLTAFIVGRLVQHSRLGRVAVLIIGVFAGYALWPETERPKVNLLVANVLPLKVGKEVEVNIGYRISGGSVGMRVYGKMLELPEIRAVSATDDKGKPLTIYVTPSGRPSPEQLAKHHEFWAKSAAELFEQEIAGVQPIFFPEAITQPAGDRSTSVFGPVVTPWMLDRITAERMAIVFVGKLLFGPQECDAVEYAMYFSGEYRQTSQGLRHNGPPAGCETTVTR
jgi:hypothetical protein